MNTKKLLVTLTSVVLAVAGSSAVVACSSDDNSNPAPTPLDGSTGTDGSSNLDSSPGTDSGHSDTGTGDGGTPDATPCTSDAATCNSCVTEQSDPLHACAPATANCIPFDNTRVPANVPLP
jgi:hypothetical protein